MKSYSELEHLNSRISIYRRVTRKGEPGSFYARIRIADGKPIFSELIWRGGGISANRHKE